MGSAADLENRGKRGDAHPCCPAWHFHRWCVNSCRHRAGDTCRAARRRVASAGETIGFARTRATSGAEPRPGALVAALVVWQPSVGRALADGTRDAAATARRAAHHRIALPRPCLTAAARYPRPTNIPRTWKSQVPSAALSHTWLRGGPARGRATTKTTTARPVRWECAWSHRLPLVRWFSDNRPGQPPGLGASSAVPLPVARMRVRTCRYRRRLRIARAVALCGDLLAYSEPAEVVEPTRAARAAEYPDVIDASNPEAAGAGGGEGKQRRGALSEKQNSTGYIAAPCFVHLPISRATLTTLTALLEPGRQVKAKSPVVTAVKSAPKTRFAGGSAQIHAYIGSALV